MYDCCQAAKADKITDSDCAAMPPRPAGPPTPKDDYSNEPITDDDYCVPTDYDLKSTRGKADWTTCCKDASMANVKDKDCDSIKF